MSKKLHKSYQKSSFVLHIYAFALVWMALIFTGVATPTPMGFTTLIVASTSAGLAVYVLLIPGKDVELENILSSDFIKAGDASSAEVLEGLRQLDALQATSDGLKNKDVHQRVAHLIVVAKQILTRIVKNPALYAPNRRLINHHLPTIIRLVEQYKEMEGVLTKGENVVASMGRVEQAFVMMDEALQKKLDALYSHTALDLEADVDVLESILKKDGFIDTGSLAAFTKDND